MRHRFGDRSIRGTDPGTRWRAGVRLDGFPRTRLGVEAPPHPSGLNVASEETRRVESVASIFAAKLDVSRTVGDRGADSLFGPLGLVHWRRWWRAEPRNEDHPGGVPSRLRSGVQSVDGSTVPTVRGPIESPCYRLVGLPVEWRETQPALGGVTSYRSRQRTSSRMRYLPRWEPRGKAKARSVVSGDLGGGADVHTPSAPNPGHRVGGARGPARLWPYPNESPMTRIFPERSQCMRGVTGPFDR